MEYNETNTGGGGRVTQGSSGRDINEYSSVSDSVLEGMNSPTYTDRVAGRNPDNTVGGYKNTGFGRGTSTDDSSNNFGYGSNISGGGITASGKYWTLPVRDRIFLSQEFVPNNPNDVKRLQHILGRTPTGIMDAFTKQRYRAMMGMDQNNNDPMDRDIYGYGGRKNQNVAQIRQDKLNASRKARENAKRGMHKRGWRDGPPGDNKSYNTNILKEKVAWKLAWQKYKASKLIDSTGWGEMGGGDATGTDIVDAAEEMIEENVGGLIGDSSNEQNEDSNEFQNQTQSMLEIALSQIEGMEDWNFGW
jgi:hypothetical protein